MRVVVILGSHKHLVATSVATRGDVKVWKWLSIDLSVPAIACRVMADFWQWKCGVLKTVAGLPDSREPTEYIRTW